jgi:hypothetical protein
MINLKEIKKEFEKKLGEHAYIGERGRVEYTLGWIWPFIEHHLKQVRNQTLEWVLGTIKNNEGSSSPKNDVIKQIRRKLHD